MKTFPFSHWCCVYSSFLEENQGSTSICYTYVTRSSLMHHHVLYYNLWLLFSGCLLGNEIWWEHLYTSFYLQFYRNSSWSISLTPSLLQEVFYGSFTLQFIPRPIYVPVKHYKTRLFNCLNCLNQAKAGNISILNTSWKFL